MFQKKSVIGIHLIFAVLFIMDSSVVGSPLSVHPTNPHYFTNKSGKAIYMTGSHTWYILHEEGHPITEDRLRSYLDWIKSWNHNYIRIWSNWFPMKNDMGFQHPWPYMRTGPGLAHDGLPKFDLTKPSKDYFNLLRFFINESQKRQLYCSVMLFGSFVAWKEEQNKFKTNVAWAPDNNVNPETRVLEVGKDFFKMDKDLLEIQKAHVRNVIDALNEYDNFVWEIMNEAMFPESKEWQYYIIDYIHAYEKTKKKQHLVIMSGGPGEMKDILEKSNADIISPAWSSNGKYFLGGPASYSDKIVINIVIISFYNSNYIII